MSLAHPSHQRQRQRTVARRRTLSQGTPPLCSSRRLKRTIDYPAQWKTRQHRPNGKTPPVNSDCEEETAKNPNRDESSGETSTSSSPSAPADKSYTLFINVIKSSGWERSKLMTVITGVCYYRCQGLYLQHLMATTPKTRPGPLNLGIETLTIGRPLKA